MDKKWRVGLKYCGHCNATIKTSDILDELKEKTNDFVDFVRWDDTPYDLLLVMGGCHVSCAQVPDFMGPVITVAGNMIDLIPFDVNEMASELAARIKEELENLAA